MPEYIPPKDALVHLNADNLRKYYNGEWAALATQQNAKVTFTPEPDTHLFFMTESGEERIEGRTFSEGDVYIKLIENE